MTDTIIVAQIDAKLPESAWLDAAYEAAQSAVNEAGEDWLTADVVVALPDKWQCMTKAPGAERLVWHDAHAEARQARLRLKMPRIRAASISAA